MNVTALLNLLINVALVGAICYVFWWLATKLPEPFSTVMYILIAIVAVVFLVGVLSGGAVVSIPTLRLLR